MQLSKQTVQFISNVIKVARILKIEHLIIDNECVRGHNQDEGLMVIESNLPKFEFTSLGISRIDILSHRLGLLGENIVVNAEEKVESPTSTVISKLIISNDKTEIEFKCASINLLQKSPRVLKDPIYFTFNIVTDTIILLNRSQSAFKGETIALVGNKKGITVKLHDIDGDQLNHIITEQLLMSSECDKDKFYFSYKNKILLSLLKEAIVDDTVQINITRRGILNLKVLGINVYVTPEL